MALRRKFSPAIRVTCGVLGLLGFAAIGFNAVQAGEFRVDFLLFAGMFAGFLFLYVAIFGANPIHREESDDEPRN